MPEGLLLLGGGLLVTLGLHGLITGVVYFANPRAADNKGWISRSAMPAYYWLGVSLYLASGFLGLAFWRALAR